MPRLSIISVALLLVAGAWIAASTDWRSIGGNSSGKPGDGVAAAAVPPEGGRRDGGNQKVSVEAATATATSSSTDLRAIGSLQSDESVQIASEIAGRVTALPFSEGGTVKAGDVLVKLDDALVQAEVSDTQARYELATGNLGRANTLAKSGNVTERARDEATANSETARAALELAKVRLSKHIIRAPFSGVVGIRKVSPGAYVAIGQPIVNIEKIDTLKVEFKLPELFLSQIKVGQEVEVEVDALPGRTFPGTIYAIDPQVDVNGRALAIRAKLPNPDLVLRPGLFVRIVVKGVAKRSVLVVPESAIVPRGADKIVFSVENGKAIETKVTLGARKDGRVEVLDGLKPDAVVVTAGQQKLKNGSSVEFVAGAPAPGSGT
jgi:membrane fusion protein (multidrug efflux system)